ncbi:flagellar hook-associated protein FlgL [Bacillus sp. DJP31]|uniref:flagellar hook-associated protein FlgL n=1 Tax=Bacillus sp. DJP31 TaxID=3409789 RepID=UPI003BB760AC
MRVTQSMLANSMLRNLSSSYSRLDKYQEQLSTGKKISRPSDDPVIAMKGMNYRTDLTEIEQYQRNLSEAYNWVENTDAAYDKGTSAVQRIRELVVQASNDTYEGNQREAIAVEIKELANHLESIANTKVGNKFIFNGSDTTSAPVKVADINLPISSLPADGKEFVVTYKGREYINSGNGDLLFSYGTDTIEITDPAGTPGATFADTAINTSDLIVSKQSAVPTDFQEVKIELSKGVNIVVNSNPTNTFSATFFSDLKNIISKLENNSTGSEIGKSLETIDSHLTNIVSERALIGARYNRVELIEDRLSTQEVIANKMLSNNEDADIERVITDLKIQETVHRAALGVGAKVIQPSLLDFLR